MDKKRAGFLSALPAWLQKNRFSLLILLLAAVLFLVFLRFANDDSGFTQYKTASGLVQEIGTTEYYTGSADSETASGVQTVRLLITSGDFSGMQWQSDYSFDTSNGLPLLKGGANVTLNLQVKNGELLSVGISAQTTSLNVQSYETAKVLEIVSEEFSKDTRSDELRGEQVVRVRLTSGQFEGMELTTSVTITPLSRARLQAGDTITICINTEDGSYTTAQITDLNRLTIMLLLAAVFIVITVLVGGKTGAKSLLGLILTLVCLYCILIPLFLRGYPTVLSTILTCVYITVVCFVILGGTTKKVLCAILGTVGGLTLAALFGWIAQALTRVSGFKMADSSKIYETMLIPIDMHGLMICGLMIAALGAVMDVAMSLSSAQQELSVVNPKLKRRDLWRSGMNIGHDMVGTMTNTLILAFFGNSLLMMMALQTSAYSVQEVFCTGWFIAELVQSLASSIGVILAVPLTALLGAMLFGKHHPQTAKQPKK